ncbi:MAG: hydrogenase maturation nickel metallochaperone HypA/HybF [Gaiellaceae bacterium]
MHELSLASAIIEMVEHHAEGRRVRVIRLRVGTLRQVVRESLEFYVELVGRDTVCEGAFLEFEVVPARLACCGGEWEPPGFRCSRCGGGGTVVAGDELRVESLEIAGVGAAEPEGYAPCIAHT